MHAPEQDTMKIEPIIMVVYAAMAALDRH